MSNKNNSDIKINQSENNVKVLLESDPLEKSFHTSNFVEENNSIDYMAKDYESFKTLLLQLASKKFPDWHEKTEADIRMVLIDLFSYVADELSYYQDRIANEAFLRTARKRDSVSSLLSLIDYRLHNGCSAQTFLNITVNEISFLPKGFQVSNKTLSGHQKIVFETDRDYSLYPSQNKIKLFFDVKKNKLEKGSTSALLLNHFSGLKKDDYIMFQNSENCEVICLDDEPELIELSLSKNEFDRSDLDSTLSQNEIPKSIKQPVTKISWSRNDYLRNNYDVNSTIYANILKITQGQTNEKSEILKSGSNPSQKHYKLKQNSIAFVSDSLTPYLAKSTVQVWVDGKPWKEVYRLREMNSFDECYRISIDDEDSCLITFGDGKQPFPWSTITARYKIGMGRKGNVGSKILTEFDSKKFPFIKNVTNLLPAKGGVDKQSLEDAKIRGPKTLKIQERAVTPEDYSKLIKKQFPIISQIQTRFSHNGGWNTLEILLDMKNNIEPDKRILKELKIFIDKIRMIGYDAKISLTEYISPEIEISIFLEKNFIKTEVESKLNFLLGDKEDETGNRGFFHPENFSFGDSIYISKLYDVIENIHGVDYAIINKFKISTSPYIPTEDGKDEATIRNLKRGFIPVNERNVLRLDNNPLYPEHGSLVLNFVESRS